MGAISLAFRFALELGALTAFAYTGWKVTDTTVAQILLALLLPAAGVAVWGRFVAPRSSTRLPDPWRLIPEIAVFGGAALGLVLVDQPELGIAFAVLALISLVLVFALDLRAS